MPFKNFAFLAFLSVIGIVIASLFAGNVYMTNVLTPFSTLNNTTEAPTEVTQIDVQDTDNAIQFVDADILEGWIPWVIKQVSILVGGLSLVVFFYAGVSLIIFGDNEEELAKSSKMIVFGIVGIALAALSYSIVANLLVIF
ncbi:MAG: hypothetical protein P1V18_00610 [Candidatus Gracilibacteria bacterium]|nr:hypothetical protein [Candidatus Gracilibacteria bacterium]